MCVAAASQSCASWEKPKARACREFIRVVFFFACVRRGRSGGIQTVLGGGARKKAPVRGASSKEIGGGQNAPARKVMMITCVQAATRATAP